MRSALLYPAFALLASSLLIKSALGGFNEDGFVDLFFITGGSPEICLGGGNGGFNCSYNREVSMNDADDIDIGDINRDGHLDIVLADSLIGRRNHWCAGDGNGGFDGSSIFCHDFPGDDLSNSSNAVSLGDVDHDYDLDAVFANQGQNRVCFGDGSGGFDCAYVSESVYGSRDVDLADFNGDGFLDAVFANSGGLEEICMWRESEGFECSVLSDDSRNSYYVATKDMNGDGIVDIVFANHEPDVHQLCLGDNSGQFSCDNLGTDATRPGGVALGDVNDDGYEDAIFASINQRNRACFGDGKGNFSCFDVSDEESFTTGVVLADVNDDGRIEVIFANQGPAANKICSWDGVSAFGCTVISGIIPGGNLVATTFNVTGYSSNINAGFNDAWFNPATKGQGFLITVFPEIKQIFLAWFTFDTERPPGDGVR